MAESNLTSVFVGNGTDCNSNWMESGCISFSFFLNAVIVGSLCLLGLAGNTISILVLRRDKHNEVASFLLQTLAVADNSLLTVSFIILTAFVGIGSLPGVGHAMISTVPYLKKYLNPLGYMTMCFTIWTTVLLAINRFLAVCKPFAYDRHRTVRRVKVQVVVIFLFSVFLNVPRIFQYDVDYRVNSRNETVPVSVLTPLGKNRVVEMVYYNVISTTVILGAPILLLICFNALLIRQLHVSVKNMRRNSITYIGAQEKNITSVMIIIIVEFLICHTPDRIINILKYASESDSGGFSCPHPLFYAASISNVLIVFNSSSNFIVYYCFRRRFRRILKTQVCSECWCYGLRDCPRPELDADDDQVLAHPSESSEMGCVKPRMNGNGKKKSHANGL